MTGLYLIIIGTLLSLNSITTNKGAEPKGNFGGNGKNAPSLQLNENHTFIYTDLTNPSKPINAEGTWSMEADELILKPNSKTKLNKHYKIIRDGKCVQTRKHFVFYTLCNCN